MITAFLAFCGNVITAILKALSAFVKWVHEHPKQAAALLIAILLVVATWYFTMKHTEARVHAEDAKVIAALQAEVKKANDDRVARDAKIARIETESKQNAEVLTAEVKASKDKLAKISNDYEHKLAAEKAKSKIVYVKDPDAPAKDIAVTIDKGEVVCQRLPDAFTDTVNDMIDEVNAPLTIPVK